MGKLSAKIEAANTIVSEFGKNLDDYNTEMDAYINQLYSMINSLGNYWKGDLYESFKRKMCNELNKLQSCIQRGKNLKTELDQYNRQFTAALEKLRQSGE